MNCLWEELLHENLWEPLFFPSFLRIAVMPPKMLVVKAGRAAVPSTASLLSSRPMAQSSVTFIGVVTGWKRKLGETDLCLAHLTFPCHQLPVTFTKTIARLFCTAPSFSVRLLSLVLTHNLFFGKGGLFCSFPVQRQPGRDLLCAL